MMTDFVLRITRGYETKVIKEIGHDPIRKNKFTFIENDVLGAMEELDIHDHYLAFIRSYEGTQEEKVKLIKEQVKLLDKMGCVIITDAYISNTEFPASKYVLPNFDRTDSLDDREVIPVDEVLERESKLLESLGFISINDYVDYEWKVAYIYGNELGKKIANHLKEIVKEFEDNKE